MSNNWDVAIIVLLLIVVIALIVIGPFFTIWSLNTLFNTEIAYSFSTWAAMVWLHTILHGVRMSFKKTEQNPQTGQEP